LATVHIITAFSARYTV